MTTKTLLIVLYIFVSINTYADNIDASKFETIVLSDECNKAAILKIEQFVENNKDSTYASVDSRISEQIALLDSKSSHIQLAKFHYFKGYINYYKENDIDAIKSFLSASDFFHAPNGKTYLQYRLELLVASSYARLEHFIRTNKLYQKAFQHYYLAEEIISSLDDCEDDKYELYSLMGHAYHGLHQIEKSDLYYKKTVAIAQKINSHEKVVHAIINRGNLYLRHNLNEQAINITNEALTLAQQKNYQKGIALCHLNLCIIYNQLKQYDMALTNANEAHYIAVKGGLLRLTNRAQQEKGRLLVRMNQSQNAILHFDSCLNNTFKSHQYYFSSALRDISKAHITLGNFEKGFEYLEEFILFNDSIKRVDFQKNIKLAESLREHEATIFQNRLLDKENKLKNAELTKSRFILLFVITLVLLLTLLIIYQVRNKNKYKTQALQIKQQNDIISTKNDEILSQNKRLNDYKNNLEKLVENRTQELKEALEMAEESNKLKNAFLENISHEIRTPMNAISGFTELLAHQNEADRAKSIELVLNNTNDLRSTIDKFLEVAKVSTAEDLVDIAPVTATHFNKHVYNYFNSYLTSDKLPNNNDFIVELCTFDGLLNTDIDKLMRTLGYLIDNAIKFTNSGKVELKSVDKESYIEFTIKDTGMGIPDDKLKIIFNTFQKINPPSMLSRGTGLGLAIVDQLLKRLKGKICVDSAIGEGTQFTIVIYKDFDVKR